MFENIFEFSLGMQLTYLEADYASVLLLALSRGIREAPCRDNIILIIYQFPKI